MRRIIAAVGLSVAIATLAGCDSAPKTGTPTNVDFTKDYSPSVKAFSPNDMMDKAADAKKNAPKSLVPEG